MENTSKMSLGAPGAIRVPSVSMHSRSAISILLQTAFRRLPSFLFLPADNPMPDSACLNAGRPASDSSPDQKFVFIHNFLTTGDAS